MSIEDLIVSCYNDPIRNRKGIKFSFRWLDNRTFQFVGDFGEGIGVRVLSSKWYDLPHITEEIKEKLKLYVYKDLIYSGIGSLVSLAENRQYKVKGDED